MSERLKTNEHFKEITSCRSCESPNIDTLLELGNHKLAGFDKETLSVPLELCKCDSCNLVQLKHTTDPNLLFNENYGYKSGVNETMTKHLGGIAKKVSQMVDLQDRDIVVDIGANDGTLLEAYKENVVRVGYDPSRNMTQPFLKNLSKYGMGNIKLFMDFFSKQPFERVYPDQKAKVVTAISMFYDLDEPNKFVNDVTEILDPEGIFVIQQNYLLGMLEGGSFDNIVHEHLEYYSLLTMEPLLARAGLEVFDVEEHPLNGGSFRTYIRHEGAKVDSEGGKDRVNSMRKQEKRLSDPQVYEEFAQRVEKAIFELNMYIDVNAAVGKKIYIYGASTRGGTLLQAARIDSRQITGAAERNPDKWGKIMQSTGIPIVSEEEARANADIFLVLPWFFKEEFVKREKEFIKNGGTLVFPLPRLEVIDYGRN